MPQTFGGYPLFDARGVRESRLQYRREVFPELLLANSLAAPSGKCAAQGWLLMRRKDFVKFDRYSTSLQLVIDDLINEPLALYGLTVVQGRCVTAGKESNEDSIYLVQVTDGRGVVANPWFSFPVNAQYNVPAPAYPGRYYESSLNGASAWTWEAMLADLWDRMGAFLGAFPGLPETPVGTPEGFVFNGQSCWAAVQTVLDVLGLTVACDLTRSSGQYSVVAPGAADATFDAILAARGRPEDDLEYIDGGGGRVPGALTVLFNCRYQYAGTEETVRRDSLQWTALTPYSVTVPAPGDFAQAPGTAYVWDDFIVRLDVDGTPLAADVATAATHSTQQATAFFQRIFRGTQGFMHKTFTGLVPFKTGSLVDGVKWFQNYRLGIVDDRRCGWRTSICRGFVWPECCQETRYIAEV